MSEPIPVGVWGTGNLGAALIRQIARVPGLELVGALCFSADKAGRDVGEVLGVGPLGVRLTADPEEFISTAPQVVLHAPLDTGGFLADGDLLKLLGAGLNVITALPYRGLPWRDPSIQKKFSEQTEAGRSSFLVTGVNPDFVAERLVLTMSGLSTEISHIHVTEMWRAEHLGPLLFEAFGFGKKIDEIFTHEFLHEFGSAYFEPSIRIAAERMGRPLDRVDRSRLCDVARQDIDLPSTRVAAGTMAKLRFRWEGYSHGELFLTLDAVYYVGAHQRPEDATTDECWLIEIEGRPSLRVSVDTMASLSDHTADAGDPTRPGYYAIAALMLQAVPYVIEAPPGVLDSPGPLIHYRADLLDQSKSSDLSSASLEN